MPCYVPRNSLRTTLTGGIFVSRDGSRRAVPDHWLNRVELLDGSTLLRLCYPSCTVEISGDGLGAIFDDAVAGRLGAVSVASCRADRSAPAGAPLVTDIVFVPPPDAPSAPSDREGSDE